MPKENSQRYGQFIDGGFRYQLTSPTVAPNADAFLWNKQMMIQATCRGYATAQFMQPEPAKYSHGPTLAAKTFMQPEHPYFTHHSGRFFYLKNNDTGVLHSAPYEPVRNAWQQFYFEPGIADIRWRLINADVELTLVLSLAAESAAECWQVCIKNHSKQSKNLCLTPYFPVGYASWMNQSADFDAQLNAVVASSVTPYQKLEDYPKQKHFKDLTFFAANQTPTSWAAQLQNFEGEGGLHNPDALQANALNNQPALYECPACIMQFDLTLAAGEQKDFEFIFGPAHSKAEIEALTETLFAQNTLINNLQNQQEKLKKTMAGFEISTPDAELNHALNIWLPRQLYYHGESQRLTTDPQTRNYLQDAMGMAYIDPAHTKTALITALAQQNTSGQMPDGILLEGATELKYINQIPHTDHGVWVILCLRAYLNETADYDFLATPLPFKNSDETQSVFDHVCLTLDWLMADCNELGLSYIAQGDWCDPMNMVGPKGIGVSAWLTQALAVALKYWLPICKQQQKPTEIEKYQHAYQRQLKLINQQLWDGQWYIRGITDEHRRFGVKDDAEGQIFLNTQSWALLANAADGERKQALLNAVEEKLETPYGAMLCAPAFTHMHEHIGRVTQKFPGSGENGSVYNHACMFWCAGLFSAKEADKAFKSLYHLFAFEHERGLDRRGQLPVYVPNYYRGAYYQFPETAGRSSRLFNTGTVAWAYQLVIEQLVGITGTSKGVKISPQLPSHWHQLTVTRHLRGATLQLTIERHEQLTSSQLWVDGTLHSKHELSELIKGKTYQLTFMIGQATDE